MTSANTKKRKYEEENRVFNVEYEENYAFTVREYKPLCLICLKLLGQNKSSKSAKKIMHLLFIKINLCV